MEQVSTRNQFSNRNHDDFDHGSDYNTQESAWNQPGRGINTVIILGFPFVGRVPPGYIQDCSNEVTFVHLV